MTHKKYRLKNPFKKSAATLDVENFWTDRYQAEFKPDSKNLFRSHKVPSIKRHYAGS